MTIDDPIAVLLEQAKQDADKGIESAMAGATTSAVTDVILSSIPGIGPAIQSLIDGRARKNVERRWIELFEEFKREVEAIRETIPDEGYYGSEEFQTLMALAREQLQTTHDSRKLQKLAVALAHSGAKEFREDDKELMLRALRAIGPADLENLNHDYLKNWTPLLKRIGYSPGVLESLSRLASLGLVTENFIRPDPNTSEEQRLAVLLKEGTRRTFQLSPFGERFMLFVSSQAARPKG